MTASKVLDWALVVDIGIFLLLAIDVYLTYQLVKREREE